MPNPSTESLSTRFKAVNDRPLTPSETQGILSGVHENEAFFDDGVHTVFIQIRGEYLTL